MWGLSQFEKRLHREDRQKKILNSSIKITNDNSNNICSTKLDSYFKSLQNALNLIKKDIVSISAGNYGGKLGQYHFHLRKIMK